MVTSSLPNQLIGLSSLQLLNKDGSNRWSVCGEIERVVVNHVTVELGTSSYQRIPGCKQLILLVK